MTDTGQTAELIERLREYQTVSWGLGPNTLDIIAEAAAALTASLSREAALVEALEAMVKSADDLANSYGFNRIEELPGSALDKARRALKSKPAA